MKPDTFLRSLATCFVVFFLFSCGNVPETEDAGSASPFSPLKDSAEILAGKISQTDFLTVLNGISIAAVDQYIHPEKGLWLIQSSGAMPGMVNISQVDKNFPVDFSKLRNEEVPTVDCDAKSFWTKEGCFAQEADLFSDTQIWEHSNLSKEDKDKVVRAAQTIKWTVVNTSLSARYYFSLIDGKWYLAFVDLRAPCQA